MNTSTADLSRQAEPYLQTEKETHLQAVRDFLGANMISPTEISPILWPYTSFAPIPSRDMLEACKQKECVLVAGPPQPISLSRLAWLYPEAFDRATLARSMRQPFAEDVVLPGWLMIRSGLMPKSTWKTWDAQRALAESLNERIPSVTQLVWTVILFVSIRKRRLFTGVYARTSTINTDGLPVDVTVSTEGRIEIGSNKIHAKTMNLGLAGYI